MKSRYLLTLVFAFTNALPEDDNAKEESNKFIYSENLSIRRFQEYLQIDTSQPENLHKAVEFWRVQAESAGLTFNVYEPAGKPICVITWEGANSSLPSIMLNSHMDVVPVEPLWTRPKGVIPIGSLVRCELHRTRSKCSHRLTGRMQLQNDAWTYPPFSGFMDENGDIFGRGAQDTKDVSVQYLEAISALRQDNVTLQRTLHITLMPDEETGGAQGINAFIKMAEFKELNIGFALDEGSPSQDDKMIAFYTDKRPWEMEFTIEGKSGHGSSLEDGTAMQKVAKLVDTVMKLRAEQMEVMKSSDGDSGKYTTVNINVIQGGVAMNVIPSQFRVVIDMRLAVDANVTDMDAMVSSWIENAGPNISMKYLYRVNESPATSVDDSNRYWVAMREAAKEMNITIKPTVCQGTTDMTALRKTGVPALGFAPAARTAPLAHAFDERLNAATFLHGIQVYVKILEKLGNLPA